jgi:UDP-glucuronate 4-epimerase
MTHSYSNIYKLPCTGVRFFTVYGPYGRPDMSLFKFTKAILESKIVNLFNFGNHVRDFTYIDDATNAVVKLIDKPPRKKIPYAIYNIASSKPQNLKFFLKTIERILGKKAKIKYKALQPGDINKTYASIKLLQKKVGFVPNTDIEQGIEKFIEWYRNNKLKLH